MDTVSGAERFIAAFNRIHQTMRVKTGRPSAGFGALVNALKVKDGLIQDHVVELDTWRQLRNALAHDTLQAGVFIADPREDTVRQIEEFSEKLSAPLSVHDMFGKDVVAAQATDTIRDILQRVRELDFSQFPVYHVYEFKGVLTAETLMQWLAHK